MTKGLVLAAPASGCGKTVITLALLRAFRRAGVKPGSLKIGPDYIERSTCFGHVKVLLAEVRLLKHRRPALRVESKRNRAEIERRGLEPRRTPGRICLVSGNAHISFSIKAGPFDSFMPDLDEACFQAAILDDWTGEVTPPDDTESVHVVREAAALCHRARRRYIALGILQIICLPGVLIFWLAAVLVGIIFINCTPFSFVTAIENFRKAATVKRTCTQFEM